MCSMFRVTFRRKQTKLPVVGQVYAMFGPIRFTECLLASSMRPLRLLMEQWVPARRGMA
jgi:hypothetical protein